MVMKKLGFLFLFIVLGVALFWASPSVQAIPTGGGGGNCFNYGSDAIDDLTSTPFSFNCATSSTVYFGVCDNGSVPNDDTFTMEYGGNIVAYNYFQNNLEYAYIGSASASAGTNTGLLTSTSNAPVHPATYFFVTSSDPGELSAYLGAFCGVDFAGQGVAGICDRFVPVFTTDKAPSNGTLKFNVQFGEDSREEGSTLRVWDISAGQQINNDYVIVPAPQWARLWWQPDGENTWYLLPSQYWLGDGTSRSEYGVSCDTTVVPSYHTSFANAIPQSEVPAFHP